MTWTMASTWRLWVLASMLFGGVTSFSTQFGVQKVRPLTLQSTAVGLAFNVSDSTSATIAIPTPTPVSSNLTLPKLSPVLLFTAGIGLWIVSRFMSLKWQKYLRLSWRFALVVFLQQSLWNWKAVKRRQASDPTSEWGRYARNPGARGRALMITLLRACLGYMKGSLLRNTVALEQSGQQLTMGLLQLGPLYIKLGQIVSCRPESVPNEWLKALERLQDQVPAFTGEKARQLAYSAYGKELFESTFSDFDDTPIAAASLGQVHRAIVTKTGEQVAIKLQRPYLRDMYDQDFALLTKMAKTMDSMSARFKRRSKENAVGDVGGISQNWTAIFQDAEAIMYREIDYRDEANNVVRFCNDFGLGVNGTSTESTAKDKTGSPIASAAGWIRTPYCYRDLSTEKALVLEYVPSIKITNSAALDKAGVTDSDKEYLADCLGRSYLRQFCSNNFFSTDPHPGNLGVELRNTKTGLRPSERVRLVFYDFGQAATLQPSQGDGILDILEAIVDTDVDRSMESFQKMGVLKPDADLPAVRAKIADNYRTGKIKANKKGLYKKGIRPKTGINSLAETGSKAEIPKDSDVLKSFTLPAEYAFVGRALGQMDGVGKDLDPEFDFVTSAAPWIYEVKGAKSYVKEQTEKKVKSLFESILPTYR